MANDSNLILDLASQIIEGRLTLAYAQQVAATAKLFSTLTYPMVYVTCEAAERGVSRNWRVSVLVMNLLSTALDARKASITEDQLALELTTVESWLVIVTAACADVPDGRIFRDVVTRADALADLDHGFNPPANILHRLGVLHLDPYVAGRSSANLDAQMSAWKQRLYEEYGNQLAGVSAEELAMPPVGEALNTALAYFRRAAAKRTGTPRGQTLKAIAQAQVWLNIFDLPSNSSECLSAAQEALTLLPPDKFPAENAELSSIVRGLSKSPSTDSAALDAARKTLQRPVADWLAERGPIATIDIFEQTAASVSEAAPTLALDLWMAIDSLVRSQPEAVRRAHDQALIGFAGRALAADAPEADGTPLEPTLLQLFGTAQAESWPQSKTAYALLSLAASTTVSNQEAEGLEALAYCASLARNNPPDPVLDRAIPYLAAVLQTGRAVNAYENGKIGEAAKLYIHAISSNLQAAQPLAALDIVRRMVDLAEQGSGPDHQVVLNALVAGLAENALDLELTAGHAATGLIQSASRFAFAQLLATGQSKTTTVLFLLDAAKGRRFRSALANSKAAVHWLNDPRSLATEAAIANLRSQIDAQQPAVSNSTPDAISRNMILTAYANPAEAYGGATPAEQLRNLQIRFDNGLDLQLSSEDPGDWVPSLEAFQSKLDPKVILALQYIGTNSDGALTVTTLLITDTSTAAATAVIPSVPFADVLMNSGEEAITSNMLSMSVSELRDRIVSPPGPMAADSHALEALAGDYEMYLGGPLAPRLAEFKAQGKDHLCFLPHGPLHYFPFHLLGPEDQPLAADWCVSYLPHPYLLDRKPSTVTGKTELTSIGVNFAPGNAFHLEALTACEDEAATIASAFAPASTLLVGPAATESAVLNALATSRRVHISTHGLHNANAPAFQCIFLTPGTETSPGSDGILNAYELLRLDLRGLDLVTFSACETALGRFDPADNLRGIPAALLIAGVSTIVGTLWNVETDTSTFFFTTFYSLLKQQGSKKAAFQQAQSLTRHHFPKYRDWGAFQLIGSWS